jgi:hypothetical protein
MKGRWNMRQFLAEQFHRTPHASMAFPEAVAGAFLLKFGIAFKS